MEITRGPNSPPPITRLPFLELLRRAHAEGLPCTPFITADEAAQLLADARALRAVRVLDAWAARANTSRRREETPGIPIMCRLTLIEYRKLDRVFEEDTPDTARIAAAEALAAGDPELAKIWEGRP